MSAPKLHTKPECFLYPLVSDCICFPSLSEKNAISRTRFIERYSFIKKKNSFLRQGMGSEAWAELMAERRLSPRTRSGNFTRLPQTSPLFTRNLQQFHVLCQGTGASMMELYL